MSSGSDDGQCTDSEKEDEQVNETSKSSADLSASNNTSTDRGSTSHSSPDVQHENVPKIVEINKGKEHSSHSDSDTDDEEARLREKLLKKRSAAGEIRVNVLQYEEGFETSESEKQKIVRIESSQETIVDTKSSAKNATHADALSDGEEMFSMQPKELISKGSTSHNVGINKDRVRDRTDNSRKWEKVKQEKHHKQRKHERHSHIGRPKREIDQREGHKRHVSGKHNEQRGREHPRNLGRILLESKPPKSTRDRPHKERDGHEDRIVSAKDSSKNHSPKKRDLSSSRSSKPDISPKKVRLEKHTEIMTESLNNEHSAGIAVTNLSPTNDELVMESIVATVTVENATTEAGLVSTGEQISDNVEASHSQESSSARLKYSKFDSSPEDNAMDQGSPSVHEENTAITPESDSDALSDIVLRTSIGDDDMDPLNQIGLEDFTRLSPVTRERLELELQERLVSKLPIYYPGISGCRNVAEFECLNRIEEGTYGVVYRAKEKKTDEIVALKRLKMEKEKEGFPITSLREINMLLKAGKHPNIVNVREIVIGSNMDKIYLVMEYVEHDMKSLLDAMHTRQKHFTIGQVKTLMRQLLSGVAHMHDEWILHRDLKTSNLLLSHKGILKIGDFGLSREFGDPLKAYTPIVVTLWYRAPELLLGVKEYSTGVDMWSCGCIFSEFLKLKPLFPGKGEADQINRIFLELGTPNDIIWPGYSDLPGTQKMKFDHYETGQLDKRFPSNFIDKTGLEFMKQLLHYNPNRRLNAHEALSQNWFEMLPHPTPPELFPTWPAKSEMGKIIVKTPIKKTSPDAKEAQNERLYRELKLDRKKETTAGFALKFDVTKF